MRKDLLPPPPAPKVPRLDLMEAIAKAGEMFSSQGGGPSDSSVALSGAGIAKAPPVREAKPPPPLRVIPWPRLSKAWKGHAPMTTHGATR